MKIVVRKWKSHHKGTLLGFADLQLQGIGLVIHDCGYHESGGREWVSLPRQPLTEAGGRPRSYIGFANEGIRRDFQESAVAAIKRQLSPPARLSESFRRVPGPVTTGAVSICTVLRSSESRDLVESRIPVTSYMCSSKQRS